MMGATLDELPLRLTTQEVCRLARISRTTLWRRVRAGVMPRPVDHAREALFDRGALLQALGVAGLAIDNGSMEVASSTKLAAAETISFLAKLNARPGRIRGGGTV